MAYLQETLNTQFQKTSFRTSFSKLRSEAKCCLLPTPINKSRCHGRLRMGSLERILRGKHSLMRCKRYLRRFHQVHHIIHTLKVLKIMYYLGSQGNQIRVMSYLYIYRKSEGVDFLSDYQYLGKINPGPSTYTPNVKLKH
jgi:hypothetical protein